MVRTWYLAAVVVVCASCARCGRDSAPGLVVDLAVSPPDPTIPPGAAVTLSSRTSGREGATTRYKWAIAAPPECLSGLDNDEAPVTQFVAPPRCEGMVTVTLTVIRDNAQASASRLVHVHARDVPPPPPPPVPDQGDALRLSLDHVKTFHDGTDVRHVRRERNRVVTFSSKQDQGFAMMCVLPGQPSLDARGFAALEFVVPRADPDLALEVKLERADSSCPSCQCRLYDDQASALPKTSGSRIRLPLERCRDILKDVARLCFATNVENWTTKIGTRELEIGDVTFVRR